MSSNSNTTLPVGTIINDKWIILEFIAKGGMGEVYRAHQLNLKRDVVVKVVSTEWLESCIESVEELEIGLQRFRIEVQTMAQVRHPNIVQIYDFGTFSAQNSRADVSQEYIVMEYIPGNTLRETMSEEGFYPDEDLAVDWISKYFFPLLDAVDALHDLGIVHRDLKPENVLMDGSIPKLADFGLARSHTLKSVTQSIDVKGTPPYMSPEHFFDFKNADKQSDIYSLGKILYEALTGKLNSKMKPFQKESLSNPETPFFKTLDQIIQNSTIENKQNRMKSVSQLRNALTDAVNGLKEESASDISVKQQHSGILYNPKWIWSGVVLAILLVAAMSVWHLIGEPGKRHQISTSQTALISVDAKLQEQESINDKLIVSDPPPKTILAEDGATMRFINGGMVTFAERSVTQPKRTVKIKPFYMDETQVTNHQYVEFLNQNLSKIRVERLVVRGDDEIWLLTGEVIEGYKPIIYQNGRFRVSNAAYAPYPVLRVTGFGALAYANFYKRRLPTVTEWLYVIEKGAMPQSDSSKTASGADDGSPKRQIMDRRTGSETKGDRIEIQQDSSSVSQPQELEPLQKLEPVSSIQPNALGIRGMNKDVGEWALFRIGATSRDDKSEDEYVILGGIEGLPEKDRSIPSLVIRHPWESFEEVGFRCVRSVLLKSAGHE